MAIRTIGLSWILLALATTMAWLLGLAAFSPQFPDEYLMVPFSMTKDLVEPAGYLAVAGAVAGAIAGFSGARMYPRVFVIGSLAVLVMYRAFTSSFGGYCIDPGEDACILATSTLQSGLAVSLVGVVVAAVVELITRLARSR